MNPHRLPMCLLAALASCAMAGGASAQSPLSDVQTRYMGAHVLQRQVEVFRRYCAADADASRQLETGIATFRAGNPEFERALDAAPTDAAFLDGVAAFDARFVEMADAMHAYLALQPPQARCPELADNLGRMRFSAMIDEASHSAAAAVTALAP
ncbi:hypothetical protein PQS31_16305 [Luteimonas sp BLCC-B24]|uniref:hypothetical protein n=1 Tax=Luteimonas sp. BLCC-B24 TaxID=3025317 RepID=UPI00234CD59A|nr:hypothetical protein [Luteimonas sp. BLCC-B24]MDC7808380.1 hypothetical protein [Luteimonas sp. BLCC-B24]